TWSDVELPPRLVEQEARALAANAVEQARRQGRKVADPGPDAHQQYMEPARRRVLMGLLVGEVARRNQLMLDPKRLNETLRLIASTYEEPDQVIELYRNDPQLMSGLQNRVMEEQVIDWIAERDEHTDKQLGFQEAIARQLATPSGTGVHMSSNETKAPNLVPMVVEHTSRGERA